MLDDLEEYNRKIRKDLVIEHAGLRLYTTWGLFSPRAVDDGSRLLLDYLDLAEDSGPARPWTEETAAMLERERRRILAAEDLKTRAAWRNRRLTALMGHKMAVEREES